MSQQNRKRQHVQQQEEEDNGNGNVGEPELKTVAALEVQNPNNLW
jgi:hypothetical protein